MQLTAGTRLGAYEVTGSLGAGGMGEVYRARDTKLHRDVAIKVLPAHFASDRGRLARFEREAQSLAALNHPHIAQIYGVTDDPPALVMEFADGEDLTKRIARGPIPLTETLALATQIAAALEYAHDHGIIHRDLKPANIKLTGGDTIKVLDFGLAKAMTADGVSGVAQDVSPAIENSPTFTSPAMTQMGVLLGTAAYMAPEQARGQAVDRRADIWAFGVILFEMLSGKQAFAGDTISDVIASVLKNDLDWSTLPKNLPTVVTTLLKRCLTPDRKTRLRDIGEARIAIDEYLAHPTDRAQPVPAATHRWQTVALVVTSVALVGALVALAWRGGGSEIASLRTVIAPPIGISVNVTSQMALTIAPDGWTVAFVGLENGDRVLYIRGRGDFDPHKLAGTEGGGNPVFSPSGRSLAFHTPSQLKVMPVDGAPVAVGPVNDARGIAWIDETRLVYAPEAIGGLLEADMNGGAPRELTKLDDQGVERTHRWPHVLPGGRWVLFTVGTVVSPDSYEDSRIDAVDRTTGERRTVYQGASSVRYSSTGHLILTRGGSLFALRFDPVTLKTSGTPISVLQGVGGDSTTGVSHAALSDAGTLAFAPSDRLGGLRQFVWVDLKGQRQSVALPPAVYSDVRISPDGTRAALLDGSTGTADVWVYGFARGTYTRLTFTRKNATPIWTPDSREIYFSAMEAGNTSGIYKTSADGGRAAVLIASPDAPRRLYLKNVSRDGTWALVDYIAYGGARANVGRLPLKKGAQIEPLVDSLADEYGGALSPDERYVAYQSDEGNRADVYVRPMSGAGGRWQVSNAGGEEPMWSRDGKSLYYRYEGRFMRVSVEPGPTFQSGLPEMLFDGIFNLRSDTGVSYDPHPEGGRFLMIRAADLASGGSIRLITNWAEQLRAIK